MTKIFRRSPYEDFWIGRQLRKVLPRDYLDSAGGVSLDNSLAQDQDIALRSPRQLVILDLTGTQVTSAGVVRFQVALPNCLVVGAPRAR